MHVRVRMQIHMCTRSHTHTLSASLHKNRFLGVWLIKKGSLPPLTVAHLYNETARLPPPNQTQREKAANPAPPTALYVR